MLNIHTTFFDLDKIAESGQCFRWKRPGSKPMKYLLRQDAQYQTRGRPFVFGLCAGRI